MENLKYETRYYEHNIVVTIYIMLIQHNFITRCLKRGKTTEMTNYYLNHITTSSFRCFEAQTVIWILRGIEQVFINIFYCFIASNIGITDWKKTFIVM